MTSLRAMPGRVGPSHGLAAELLPRMLDHTIRTFFPTIWEARGGDSLRVRGVPFWMRALPDRGTHAVHDHACRTGRGLPRCCVAVPCPVRGASQLRWLPAATGCSDPTFPGWAGRAAPSPCSRPEDGLLVHVARGEA